MVTETQEEMRQLYLDDLNQTISYDGGKTYRPRVRHTKNYEKIPLTDQINIHQYNNVWFISDTHFGHKNIIKFCDRPFGDVFEMTDTLVNNHNSVVGENDLVIWGGDVAFLADDIANQILARLNGDRILVIGNHDLNKGKVKNLDFKEKHLLFVIDDGEIPLVLTHFPFNNCPEGWINIHGHVHNSPVERSKDHQVNISAEVIEFTPIHFDRVKEMARARYDSLEIK